MLLALGSAAPHNSLADKKKLEDSVPRDIAQKQISGGGP
jgi:hypothetical protein